MDHQIRNEHVARDALLNCTIYNENFLFSSGVRILFETGVYKSFVATFLFIAKGVTDGALSGVEFSTCELSRLFDNVNIGLVKSDVAA